MQLLTAPDLAPYGFSLRTAQRLLARLHREGIATVLPTRGRPTYAITPEALAAALAVDTIAPL